MGHGVRKPDYDAAYKSQQLLLGVPAPALRHSFAQHLIRGEKIMDPDAGVRRRVMVSRSICTHSKIVVSFFFFSFFLTYFLLIHCVFAFSVFSLGAWGGQGCDDSRK